MQKRLQFKHFRTFPQKNIIFFEKKHGFLKKICNFAGVFRPSHFFGLRCGRRVRTEQTENGVPNLKTFLTWKNKNYQVLWQV